MASHVVLQRDSSKLEVDKGIENCWKWEWRERSVDLSGKLISEEMSVVPEHKSPRFLVGFVLLYL